LQRSLAGRGPNVQRLCRRWSCRRSQRGEHHPARLRGGFERKGCSVGGTAAAEQLARERGPRGIRIAMVQFKAMQAGAGARGDEWSDLNSAFAEHHRKVRYIASQPRPTRARGKHIVADNHRGVCALGLADRCRGLSRIAQGEHARSAVGERGNERICGRTKSGDNDGRSRYRHPRALRLVGCTEQHASHRLKEGIALRRLATGEHVQTRASDTCDERGNQPLGRWAHIVESHSRRINANLHAHRRAPHNG